MIEIPPFLPFLIGAVLFPFLKWRRLREGLLLLIPLLVLWQLPQFPHGSFWKVRFLEYELTLLQVDKLSLVFGYIFSIMAFIGFLYGLHVRRAGEQMAALLYVGSSLGVTFAGDLFTLFLFWELMAASSVFLIWYRGDRKALWAGFRYILFHVFGGCALLAGIILHYLQVGSLQVGPLPHHGVASSLILLGFLVNAAVPPLHPWLPDAYPEGTITGSVFLTAYTTKSAVYILARTFAGMELLMWAGAVMALYGVIFAMMEDDLRRLLAYHIVSQVGYMVCGVGIGGAMGVNGAVAHAFCHILYKALLFMGAGAVIYVTGKRTFSQLANVSLWRAMPLTLILYLIGGFSISGVPLFNGFVSKSMVIAASVLKEEPLVEILLVLASVGTFYSTTLKLPYLTWFGRGKKKVRVEEPRLNMLLGMGVAALLCILLGVWPKPLYDALPFPVHYKPYTPDHIVGTMGLLLGTVVAFRILLPEIKPHQTITLDFDWFYRKLGRGLLVLSSAHFTEWERRVQERISSWVVSLSAASENPFSFFLPRQKAEEMRAHLRRNLLSLGPLFGLLFLFFYTLFFLWLS